MVELGIQPGVCERSGDSIAHSLGLINDCVLFLWSVYFYIELLDEIIPLTNHSLVCVTTINSIIEQHC